MSSSSLLRFPEQLVKRGADLRDCELDALNTVNQENVHENGQERAKSSIEPFIQAAIQACLTPKADEELVYGSRQIMVGPWSMLFGRCRAEARRRTTTTLGMAIHIRALPNWSAHRAVSEKRREEERGRNVVAECLCREHLIECHQQRGKSAKRFHQVVVAKPSKRHVCVKTELALRTHALPDITVCGGAIPLIRSSEQKIFIRLCLYANKRPLSAGLLMGLKDRVEDVGGQQFFVVSKHHHAEFHYKMEEGDLARTANQLVPKLDRTKRQVNIQNNRNEEIQSTVVLQLLDVDKAARVQFCEWFLYSIAPENMRHWSDDNPHVLTEPPLHPQKLGAWCAVSSRRIIPVFFHETVNSARYIEHIFNVFAEQLTEDERKQSLLSAERSYGTYCTCNDHANIITAIDAIPQHVLARAFHNFWCRLHTCLEVNGGHLQHLL
ncbi:hypothetical protein PR048_020201 [Dryococelus australis]|uniref:MULE transposase domain-containing protein n=1 Tax=Dryococelus australis TaxID=614101 RepID=A0ABQ9H606_9NEOP|nr:hypothetical protein PR048_020201 [Dryococelus australis]